jgi:hypothetical protein
MPRAARDFAIGNRMVKKGEEFTVPQGQEAEFAASGLIEGEEPAQGDAQTVLGPEPLGDAPATEPAPGAAETPEETAARAEGTALEAERPEDRPPEAPVVQAEEAAAEEPAAPRKRRS